MPCYVSLHHVSISNYPNSADSLCIGAAVGSVNLAEALQIETAAALQHTPAHKPNGRHNLRQLLSAVHTSGGGRSPSEDRLALQILILECTASAVEQSANRLRL